MALLLASGSAGVQRLQEPNGFMPAPQPAPVQQQVPMPISTGPAPTVQGTAVQIPTNPPPMGRSSAPSAPAPAPVQTAPTSMSALNKVVDTPAPAAAPDMSGAAMGAPGAGPGMLGDTEGALRMLGRRMPPMDSMALAGLQRRVY